MKTKELDIIVPISIELDFPTRESVVQDIIEQHEKYGFKKFALACPCAGWRPYGHPPLEHYIEKAELFASIKRDLVSYDITLGWWLSATMKSGHSKDFTPIIKSDGSAHPFSNCPLDPAFREIFAKSTAAFAKIAKPAFIITEDDYSIHAASIDYGCFCHHHLAEFSKREGKEYSREELIAIFHSKSKERRTLLKKWRELIRDSIVGCSEAVRAELDKESPEIPMGCCQPGVADDDGDTTYAMCRAFAGKNHTPFSRIRGSYYGTFKANDVPRMLYHPLYSKQHLPEDFICIHESDTFPHMRFFSAGKEITALMGAVYSMGFDGSLFQTQQLLDCPNEEVILGLTFKKKRPIFENVHQMATQCKIKGIELYYDPFDSTADKRVDPLFTQAISLMGIPYTSLESSIAFLDKYQVQNWEEEKILKYLSKNIFIDGEAAKILCERGFGKYLGVTIGKEITKYEEFKKFNLDLAAREIICEKYREDGKGCHMTNPYMLAVSYGKLLKTDIIDPKCEPITEIYNFKKEYVTAGMTRYKNKLGGNVVVFATTIESNFSQSMINYRRQRILQRLIIEFSDEYVLTKEVANIYTIMNEAINEKESGFFGMVTLINLCSDTHEMTELHLPKKWRENREFFFISAEGKCKKLDYLLTNDGIIIKNPIEYLEPIYIICK